MSMPKIGLSACLMGHPVRYNGAHKKNDWIVDHLSKAVSFYPICPEIAMGLPTPRPTLRLIRDPSDRTRLVYSNTNEDLTEPAESTAHRIISMLPDLSGFILKRDSPSCGLERVKVYPVQTGIPLRTESGIFAKQLRHAFPLLPMIEEGRLADPAQRDQFVTQVFAYYRWKQVAHCYSEIQSFHRKYKLILMEHSPEHYRKLGKLIGNAEKLSPSQLMDRYFPLFMEALAVPVNPGKRVNVLEHALGYLKIQIDSDEKKQILDRIAEYREGILPFIVPLSLIEYLIHKFSISYLEEQFFFMPYPKEVGFNFG